jgi:hypothetical protein
VVGKRVNVWRVDEVRAIAAQEIGAQLVGNDKK